MKQIAGKDKHNLLADKVAGILRAGMVLDRKVTAFIETACAAPPADGIAEILADPDSCEAAPVYELLFFPDEAIQAQLEPLLKQNKYDDQDVCAVIDKLTRKQLQTKILLPENQGDLKIRIPDSAICQFVYRLNITRHIPRAVSQALTRCIPETKEIYRVRVQLRNARLKYSGGVCKFLSEFIEKVYPIPELFKDALPLILDFLDQIKPETEIYPALIGRKHLYVKMIRQSEKIERALNENSVEALILKGVSVPAINIEETNKKIAIIDRVCLLVYGKTGFEGEDEPVTVNIDSGI